MEFSQYTTKNVNEVFEDVKTSLQGLSKQEVLLRQKKYGSNEVTVHSISLYDILLRQFQSPFFYLLLIAGIVAFFIGEKIDSIVILLFILINVIIGFAQEFRAEKTVSLLKNLISPKTRVVRSGKQEMIDKKELVIGDIVSLLAGDIVPAELRIIEASNLLVDESVLTGESVSVFKTSEALKTQQAHIFNSTNMVFAGSSVVSGRATCVVVGTGKNTELGTIIGSLNQKRPQGIYEKNLVYFCRLILKIVLATVALIFIINLLLKGTTNFFEFLLFSVALIVSILPEALPAIVILALSRGSLKMAKENVVVKRLAAIEDLGNIEILCTDKTGTLTQNKLSLEKIISSQKDKAILYSLVGSDVLGLNPFDTALLSRADSKILSDLKKHAVLSELMFDSFRMRSSVLVQTKTAGKILIVKGAPEVILKLCSKFPPGYTRPELKEDLIKEGQDGKRTFAVAFKPFSKNEINKDDERGLTFLGYFVFEDPLKSTAQEAINLAKKLGVAIKIITGDSKEVAAYVSKKTGLINASHQVLIGEELEAMHQEEFDNACEDNVVFARVSPDIKHKIIKSLQKKYEVGFLGEGINDVPALKTANVAIAVSEATDIAKEASDVVLLKKDLRVIVNGIKDGRHIFANINKYIKCALASNFGNFYSIATISLFINFLPMLPVQILLGNLLSDFPLISIVTDPVDIEELRKPKAYKLHNMLPLIIALGLVSTVFDFLFFLIFFKQSPGNIQTLWFIMSILTEIFLIFIIRTRHVFWKAKKVSLALLFFTIIDGVVILILPFTGLGKEVFHFVNPPLYGLLTIGILLIFYIALSEIVKLVYFHYFKVPKSSSIEK